MESQGRGEQWVALMPDEDAQYDQILEIDLSALEPMVALPHSRECEDRAGSWENKSGSGSGWVLYKFIIEDLKVVANALKGKTISDNLHAMISPGSGRW